MIGLDRFMRGWGSAVGFEAAENGDFLGVWGSWRVRGRILGKNFGTNQILAPLGVDCRFVIWLFPPAIRVISR